MIIQLFMPLVACFYTELEATVMHKPDLFN